jgi:hypothetical protein
MKLKSISNPLYSNSIVYFIIRCFIILVVVERKSALWIANITENIELGGRIILE